jgi:hypothetical protein
MNRWIRAARGAGLIVLSVVAGLASSFAASAAEGEQILPVNLSGWAAEDYPAVAGFGGGKWVLSGGGASVTQTVNGQPVFFASDFTSSYGTDIEGQIRVLSAGGDDDYIGFAFGFRRGDSTNAFADYLLVDWKAATQSFNFGAPSDTPGSTAKRGLAVSRVRGIPTADEFWGHVDFDHVSSPSGQGLTELGRGQTLGSTGWVFDRTYSFRFEFSRFLFRVYVDDQLEVDISGEFGDGSLAFYNFSQAQVVYSGFTRASFRDCDAELSAASDVVDAVRAELATQDAAWQAEVARLEGELAAATQASASCG